MEKWRDWLMLLVPRSVLCQLSGAATYFRCTALDIVFYLMTRHTQEIAKLQLQDIYAKNLV